MQRKNRAMLNPNIGNSVALLVSLYSCNPLTPSSRVINTQWRPGKGDIKRYCFPPLHFGLSKNCQIIFFFPENVRPIMQNLGLQTPI